MPSKHREVCLPRRLVCWQQSPQSPRLPCIWALASRYTDTTHPHAVPRCMAAFPQLRQRPAQPAPRCVLPAAQEPLLVEAPEFMTVEYLKRRVARAKLQLGEVRRRPPPILLVPLGPARTAWCRRPYRLVLPVCSALAPCSGHALPGQCPPHGRPLSAMLQVLPTARFVLRSHGPGSGGGPADSAGASGGTSSSGAAGRAFEDLPCSLPNGDEVFLASLGYEAPGPYELLLASAPQVGPGTPAGAACPRLLLAAALMHAWHALAGSGWQPCRACQHGRTPDGGAASRQPAQLHAPRLRLAPLPCRASPHKPAALAFCKPLLLPSDFGP